MAKYEVIFRLVSKMAVEADSMSEAEDIALHLFDFDNLEIDEIEVYEEE